MLRRLAAQVTTAPGSKVEATLRVPRNNLCVIVATVPNARVILDGAERTAIPETVDEGETPEVGYAQFDDPRRGAALIQVFDGETQVGPDITIDLGAL